MVWNWIISESKHEHRPFFIFVLASFTDYLDGLLARLFKEESKLGELLDPIADKILVAAALILLVMNGTIKNYEV